MAARAAHSSGVLVRCATTSTATATRRAGHTRAAKVCRRCQAGHDTLTAERGDLAAKLEAVHDTLIAERDDLAAQLEEVRSFRLVQGAVCTQLRAELVQARAASSLSAALHSS